MKNTLILIALAISFQVQATNNHEDKIDSIFVHVNRFAALYDAGDQESDWAYILARADRQPLTYRDKCVFLKSQLSARQGFKVVIPPCVALGLDFYE